VTIAHSAKSTESASELGFTASGIPLQGFESFGYGSRLPWSFL